MSCFAGMPLSPSSLPPPARRGTTSKKTWRWWWRSCVGLAASVHSGLRLRRRRRRRAAAAAPMQRGWCHHRSFAPVYVDELYSQPKNLAVVQEEKEEEPPTTGGGGNGNKIGGAKQRVWLSPGRGGSGGGMGEVDVRAELFIRKFREEMRLQREKSVEEFQAMLARGL